MTSQSNGGRARVAGWGMLIVGIQVLIISNAVGGEDSTKSELLTGGLLLGIGGLLLIIGIITLSVGVVARSRTQ